MTAFLIFTLSVREDRPLDKYMEWLPNNKVLSMILEVRDAQGNVYSKKINYSDTASQQMVDLNITPLELQHALKDGDVEFSHEKSKPRSKPKQYYILVEINNLEYFTVVTLKNNQTLITEFGKI